MKTPGVTQENLEAMERLLDANAVRTGYVESLVTQERVPLFYKELSRQHMSSELQSSVTTSDEELSKYFEGVASSVKKVEKMGDRLHGFQESSMETPMNRFLTISSAENPQPWLARQEMNDSEIMEGDMMSAAARTALLTQTENMATDEEEGQIEWTHVMRLLRVNRNNGGEITEAVDRTRVHREVRFRVKKRDSTKQ